MPAASHQQRGAEVGLLRDQADRHDQQHAGGDEVAQAHQRLVLVEVPREHQRHADLEQLRWLNLQRSHREPASCTVLDRAGDEHRDEQQHADRVDRDRESHHLLRRHVGDEPHREERGDEVADLTLEAAREVVAGAVERDERERREQREDDRQRGIEHEEVGLHAPPRRHQRRIVDHGEAHVSPAPRARPTFPRPASSGRPASWPSR